MEEVRVDLRLPNEARSAEGRRSSDLCFRINQTSPLDPRQKELIRELLKEQIGETSILRAPIFINLGENISIGEHCSIMNGFQCMSAGGLRIDDWCRISLNCTIATNNHDMYERDILTCKPVHIKRNAWLGVNVTVLPGVTIGENAVIGAGSVVTKDIPDNAVAVGSPAKVIRYLDPEKFAEQ